MPPSCSHDEAYLAYHDCQGDDRRIHALVIGVGRYAEAAPRFGTRLDSLPGAALAAYRFAHYLINEFQFQQPHGRLSTLRLMLNPLDRERAVVGSLRYGPAERRQVAVALREWANDCNLRDQDLAIMYVAGHGVALDKGTSLLFLADAPTEASLALAAINLELTESRMKNYRAKNNMFFFDCCAVPADTIPDDQAGAMSIGRLQKQAGKKRASLLCVNAARVGTKTFAIDDEGTLLARGLLGDYRDQAGDDALLRTAGELVPSGRFGVTPYRLEEMLSPCLQDIAKRRRAPYDGYEATITGKFQAAAITVPEPTPRFKLTLTKLLSGRTGPIAITLFGTDGAEPLALFTDADDLEVTVNAGDYIVEISSPDVPSTRRRLQLTGQTKEAVPA